MISSIYTFRSPESTRRTVPGPSGIRRARLLWRFATSENRTSLLLDADLLLELRDEFGPLVRLSRPIGDDVYFVVDPSYVRYVLESGRDVYRKCPSQMADLTKLFGRGLVTSDGDYWRRHKRAIAPTLSAGAVEPAADVAVEETERRLDRWDRADDAIPVLEEMRALAFDVLGRSMFGDDYREHRAALVESIDGIQGEFPRIASPRPTAPAWVPTAGNRRFARALSLLRETFTDLIERRRRSTSTHRDLLSAVLSLDEPMTDAEIRDELRTLFVAGLGVTYATLTWCLYLLATNQWAHERLHERLSPALADGRSAADLADGYPVQVVRETLRLKPPLPPAIRRPVEDDTIDGYAIPAGAAVLVNQLPIHRDPEIWEEPLAFRPERFAPGRQEARPRYSFYPFGGGARTCVGRAFALTVVRAVVARIVADYRLELADPPDAIGDTPTEPGSVRATVHEW